MTSTGRIQKVPSKEDEGQREKRGRKNEKKDATTKIATVRRNKRTESKKKK